MNTFAGGTGGAASSLVIVPVATARVSVAPPCGSVSVTEKVSLASNTVSPSTGSRISAVVAPAANVTVPVRTRPVAKSLSSAIAVPLPRFSVQVADTSPAVPSLRVTVKTMSRVPLSPSAMVASAMASVPGVGVGAALPNVWPVFVAPAVAVLISAQ